MLSSFHTLAVYLRKHLASRPAAIYAGLGSADKYKTMLSHLGSDVKVRVFEFYLLQEIHQASGTIANPRHRGSQFTKYENSPDSSNPQLPNLFPGWVRYLIAVILRRVFGDYILTPMFSVSPSASPTNLSQYIPPGPSPEICVRCLQAGYRT